MSLRGEPAATGIGFITVVMSLLRLLSSTQSSLSIALSLSFFRSRAWKSLFVSSDPYCSCEFALCQAFVLETVISVSLHCSSTTRNMHLLRGLEEEGFLAAHCKFVVRSW